MGERNGGFRNENRTRSTAAQGPSGAGAKAKAEGRNQEEHHLWRSVAGTSKTTGSFKARHYAGMAAPKGHPGIRQSVLGIGSRAAIVNQSVYPLALYLGLLQRLSVRLLPRILRFLVAS